MVRHSEITAKQVPAYFAHPHSPRHDWKKPSEVFTELLASHFHRLNPPFSGDAERRRLLGVRVVPEPPQQQ